MAAELIPTADKLVGAVGVGLDGGGGETGGGDTGGGGETGGGDTGGGGETGEGKLRCRRTDH